MARIRRDPNKRQKLSLSTRRVQAMLFPPHKLCSPQQPDQCITFPDRALCTQSSLWHTHTHTQKMRAIHTCLWLVATRRTRLDRQHRDDIASSNKDERCAELRLQLVASNKLANCSCRASARLRSAGQRAKLAPFFALAIYESKPLHRETTSHSTLAPRCTKQRKTLHSAIWPPG